MTTAARRWCARRRVGHTFRRGHRGMRQRAKLADEAKETRVSQAVIRNVRHHKSTTTASRYAVRSRAPIALFVSIVGRQCFTAQNVVDLVLLLAKSGGWWQWAQFNSYGCQAIYEDKKKTISARASQIGFGRYSFLMWKI